LDFIEIAVVVVPIVAPILLADPSANVTAVWLGVMIGLNIQTSFLTPPFGFALFYLRGVAPATVKTLAMYKGVIAFIGLQLAALVIVGMYPSLVNYLPNRALLLSETAPPPRNPQLQYCVEKYVGEQLTQNRDKITAAIDQAKSIDLSALPEDVSEDFTDSFEDADNSFKLLDDVFNAENAWKQEVALYRPLHTQVRDIERDARSLEEEIKELQERAGRLRGDDNAAARERLEKRIQEDEAEREALLNQIPAEWEEKHDAFSALLKEENKIRTQYRRAADNAYTPTVELLATLKDTGKFVDLGEKLREIPAEIDQKTPEEMVDVLQELERQFGEISGPGDVKKDLTKARRELRSKSPDKEKAKASVSKAIESFEEESEWRAEAASQELLPKVQQYEASIRGTLGLRQQENMPRELGLYLAGCNAGHRDISLYF
jgi:hypothetical protein